MSVKFLPSLQQNFTHTHVLSSSFIVTIWQFLHVQVSADVAWRLTLRTRQMAVCCQESLLGAFHSNAMPCAHWCAVLKVLFFIFNTPRIIYSMIHIKPGPAYMILWNSVNMKPDWMTTASFVLFKFLTNRTRHTTNIYKKKKNTGHMLRYRKCF